MRRRRRAAAAVLAALVVTLTSCSSRAAAPPADLAAELDDRVGVDAVYGHLVELQKIADANDGTRADGTPGYQASVDYVTKALRDKGFDVQTPEFQRLSGSLGGKPALTVAGRTFRVDQASLLLTTAPGGVTALTLRPRKAAGCGAADYTGVAIKGAIAVVDDSGCSVVAKHDAAAAAGAVGLLVVTESTPSRPVGAPAGLFTPGYYQRMSIPVGVIDPTADAALRRTSAPVTLVLDNKPVMTTSRSVIAQTASGDTGNVVMVGAHLDSSGGGPGIDDNGSGVGAVLETALQLGAKPNAHNAVRFAFWGGGEESGDGAAAYLRALKPDELSDLALYVDLDVIGSPNAGYFTLDGDQSAQPGARVTALPEGSAGIERTLAARLYGHGVRPADMPLTSGTDYAPFVAAGIPVGGLTTGTSQLKSDVQARIWGGRSGVAFDPNYHRRGDTIDNVDRAALGVMAPTAAAAVGGYAQSIDGVNGVPARDQRNRRTP
ncbi:M28 family peptidase [Mycolicibacterium sp. 018/SC-01/001]|uniref:M28 family peptidase n=1 Tax=Mycolicibacterium sp. 018/SC-01/001 TaxID=2592069 RepID=UPI00117E4FF5|nr:M28 family peptidase [Mycolicibacterium sp. 018/SC-01/001]TRW82719.1 M28 family peptidase [Mycolicibacterium sp. 018/SC-01/001]